VSNTGISVVVSAFVSACVAAQTAATSETGAVVDREATQVLMAAQAQLKRLPSEERQRLARAFPRSLKLAGKTIGFDTVTHLDPARLNLAEKNELLLQIQRTQQVVDPGMLASPATSQDPDGIIASYQTSAPLTPAESQVARLALARLPQVSKSIGRLLWSGGDGNWHFEGTVFVIGKNIVGTACHVAGELLDGTSSQPTIRQDRTAVADFSDVELPKTGPLPPSVQSYPITRVLALCYSKGCDAAIFQITGAELIPPIPISRSGAPKRVLVVGYPQLTDLTPLVCQFAIDPTAIYFCQFRKAHPSSYKVISAGVVYTSTSHDGISVFDHNAPTRGGQSGSPVLDLDTLQVVGIHYCCTGSPDNTYTLSCASWHPQNLKWNEAISSSSLVADQSLKPYLGVSLASAGEKAVTNESTQLSTAESPSVTGSLRGTDGVFAEGGRLRFRLTAITERRREGAVSEVMRTARSQ
jgi:hypothetical protein